MIRCVAILFPSSVLAALFVATAASDNGGCLHGEGNEDCIVDPPVDNFDESEGLELRQLRAKPAQFDATAMDKPLSSNAYRLVATTTSSGWAWDVKQVKFILSDANMMSPSSTGVPCWVIESGHPEVPGYSAMNAFSDSSSFWGGRKDSNGVFFLGVACLYQNQVAAVQIEQGTKHYATEVKLEMNTSSGWRVAGGSSQLGHVVETVFAVYRGYGFLLRAPTSHSGWAWDVKRVKFMLSNGWAKPMTELVPGVESGCRVIASGHPEVPGYSAMNAFSDSSSFWGGRKDSNGVFWIGLECDRPYDIAQVLLEQRPGASHYVDGTVSVRTKMQDLGWTSIWEAGAVRDGLSVVYNRPQSEALW